MSDPQLQNAARLLLAGGVVVIPTDTVYGIAAHPSFPGAVRRIQTIKQREEKKPIALLAADLAAVSQFGAKVSGNAAILAEKFWPGALTLILECPDGKTEGFRVPDLSVTRELLKSCGGTLRVTSANISGGEPALSAVEALASVGLQADLVVDGGVSPGGVASTVVRFGERDEPIVLREGAIPKAEIYRACRLA